MLINNYDGRIDLICNVKIFILKELRMVNLGKILGQHENYFKMFVERNIPK